MQPKRNTYKLIEAACGFWFNDNDRVRSPFPKSIQRELKDKTQARYLEWIRAFDATDREEVDDEELAGVFESFLFAIALELVGEEDTDLVLTIHYPFLPRIGDKVNDETNGASRVVDRKLEQKDDDKLYMIISLEPSGDGETWQSEILIPT